MRKRKEGMPRITAEQIAAQALDELVRNPSNRFAADVYRHASNIAQQEDDVGTTKDKPHGAVSEQFMRHYYGASKAAVPTPAERRARLCDEITGYLATGGLFNPEMANHDAVRAMLIECRDALRDA
jgi:hypothetical protein